MINDPTSGHVAKAVERVLEFSADAQIKRRETAPESPTFHNLTGAIAAYGKVLRVLSKLQRLEDERYLIIGQFDLIETASCAVRPL